ncbi:MAG: putative sulfate/molybdate transporter, partial [Anaerolineae bacterium]
VLATSPSAVPPVRSSTRARATDAGAGADRRPFRLTWGEASGALADIGVLLPLAVALITVNGLSPTSVFFGVGLAYLLAGIVYRLPMPVQPLKAVSAIAIAQGLPGSLVSATGLALGLPLLLLAATGSARYLSKLFPRPIIRGLQLGVGALLVRSGFLLASRPQMVVGGPEHVLHAGPWSLPLGWLVAGAALLFLLFSLRRRVEGVSLLLLFLGVPITLLAGSGTTGLGEIRLGLALPKLGLPQPLAVAQAFVLLALPQIPLTLGNAVFATADTARLYFAERAAVVTPFRLLTTAGACQVLAAVCGGVPVCHGSGGLTAHYKLGARSGLAPIIMGTICLVLALFVDGKVLPVLALIPYPVLGTLLMFVGVQHGLLAKDLRMPQELAVALTTALVGLVSSNLALGMAAAMALRGLLAVTLRLQAS